MTGLITFQLTPSLFYFLLIIFFSVPNLLDFLLHLRKNTHLHRYLISFAPSSRQALRGVVRGEGVQKGLKPPFKNCRNPVFSLLLSNEKLHLETNSELIIPCVKSRELYSVT